MMKRIFVLGLIFCAIYNTCLAQEGFYTGIGWNTYFAKEQVKSSNNLYQFSHSTESPNDGFLTQSLDNYGIGFQIGFRKNIDTKGGKNIITLDGQYYYNYQDVQLKSSFDKLEVETVANYNHGYRLSLGHRFKMIHPYIIIQGIYQNITPHNSLVNNGGVVNDVEDDGTILTAQLDDNGSDFTNEVFSFLGGFGLETFVNDKCSIIAEYVPMKHVEYGLRDTENDDLYFVNSLVVNQLQVGVRYYFYKPFAK